jgi:hypothetical protein
MTCIFVRKWDIRLKCNGIAWGYWKSIQDLLKAIDGWYFAANVVTAY